MINDKLIVDVLAAIERDPTTWDQSMWRQDTECGTAMCFAGHAVTIAAPQLWLEPVKECGILERDELGQVPFNDGTITRWWSPFIRGSRVAAAKTIAYVAQELLGLRSAEAGTLFNSHNDLDDLYEVCANLVGVDEQVLRDKVRDAR